MKSLAPNTLLQNRYLIVHLIGKGGMGDVYLAVDQRLGSAVALKRTFFSDDEMFGTAFEREAKTLARLRHGVLPKVSDHFSENDVQFLVMEHISGDDLSKRLESAQKPFPLSWVLFWADQLLDALAYLHSHEPQIIHRDIKPQNLKLTDENSIILLDFGLSKNTEGDTKAILSGSTGSVVGYTPHYAPMEQIRGTGTNPRSDIYSLSATIYQLLTNIVPFDSLTRADAVLNGMDDPVKSINEINPEVPHAVSTVILKGMELSQDKRFQNAREMQKALREAFTQIQNSMTAQTVAFNLQSEQPAESNLPSIATLNITNTATEENQLTSVPANYNSEQSPQNFDSFVNRNSVQEQGFVETLRMDPPVEDSLPKQSGVKTEVFPQNSLPKASPRKTKEFSTDGNPSSKETSNENKAASPVKNSESVGTINKDIYAPNAAAPAFFARDQKDYVAKPSNDSEILTSSRIENETDSFATNAPANKNSREQNNRNEVNDSQPHSVKKKTSGKASFVGGGLALLLLVLGATGGGWWFYNNYYAAKKAENPVAQPSPRIELTPTPAPTAETVLETNTQSNSTSEIVSGDANTQTNSKSNDATNALNGDSTTNQTTPQTPAATKPAPQTAVKIKPKTNPTPAVKPSSKPAEKKPAAPIILQ